MTAKENVTAILNSNFTETRDDIKEIAAANLVALIENVQITEVWVVSHMIPGSFNLELKFFSNEKLAKEYAKQFKAQGATCSKYPLISELDADSLLDSKNDTVSA